MSNLLDRRTSLGLPFGPSHNLSAGQQEQDQLLGNFTREASDWKSLAAMMAGGLAYRLGNLSYLQALPGAFGSLAKLAPAFGLASEVTAFRYTHRLLDPSHAAAPLFGQEWMSDFVNFGSLKAFGKLSHGQNPIFSHFVQDAGMVAGHHLAFGLGLATRPEGSLLQQFVHAEVTNIQIAAGMGLAQQLSGHRLQIAEQAMDVRLEALRESGASPASLGQLRPSPLARLGEEPAAYSDQIAQRLGKILSADILEAQARLSGEWQNWKGRSRLEADQAARLERLLPFYARFAKAHLGRETPAQLPFVQEVYDMAAAALRASDAKAETLPADRNALIRFLSTQEGRRSLGEKAGQPEAAPSLPRISPEQTRRFMGESHAAWESYVRKGLETRGLPGLQKAQAYQRALALMHFYVQALQAKTSAEFQAADFDAEAAAQILEASSKYPYPAESVEIFAGFFKEALGKEAKLEWKPAAAEDSDSLEALPSAANPLLDPLANETWSEYITRLGLTRGRIDGAELGIAGSTVFAWGSTLDEHHRIAPPGDILGLLGVVTYANATLPHRIDPFDAIRLALPEQLKDFKPDADHTVVIRYPKSMEGLDYAHFGLGAFLRAHLRSIDSGHDMDLARLWDVSESTVAEYRQGVVRKMRLETLEKLAKNFSSSEAQQAEMLKFLMFLRYRPYFDAGLVVADRDGSVLNHRPPLPSRVKIALLPDTEGLRLPDSTQRVQFEREPFASVLNGSVDYALQLLDQKTREFELTGEEAIQVASEALTRATWRERVADLRDEHTTYFQLLAQQERSPGIVRPGELRQMQDFYRGLFRFFEAAYLHTRASSSLAVGETRIRYEIVPSTHELERGVSFQAGRPRSLTAHAVAADLLERGKHLDSATLANLLKLRIAIAYLRHQGLLVNQESHAEQNRALLLANLAQQGIEGAQASELLEAYKKMEAACLDWQGAVIDPSENAILHRITRGKLSRPASEARALHWRSDLEDFSRRQSLLDIHYYLARAFEAYAQAVEQPYREFDEGKLEDAIRNAANGEENRAEIEARLRQPLLRFMELLGLATRKPPAGQAPLSPESFARAAFATYVQRFQALHALRSKGALIADAALLDRVMEDRLADFPHLGSQKPAISRRLQDLIVDYNGRSPLLRVYEIAKAEEAQQEPFEAQAPRLLDAALQGFAAERPGRKLPSSRLLLIAFAHLRPLLGGSKMPSETDLAEALAHANRQAARLGLAAEPFDAEASRILAGLCAETLNRLESLERLAAWIPPFVARERFQSGLDEAPKLGQDLAEIYRKHARSMLLDPTPGSLRGIIAEKISERFEPYAEIQEDVLRGLHALYHEMLRSMRDRYSSLATGLELAALEAREHKSRNLFAASLRRSASEVDPALDSIEALKRHAKDLETLFELGRAALPPKLSEKIEEAEREVEALEAAEKAKLPSVDAGELLKAAIDPRFGDAYPEIFCASEAEVRAQIDGKQERRALAVGEARALVQLMALLNRQYASLSEGDREVIDDILLEIDTSNDGVAEISKRAFEAYKAIQTDVVSMIPAAEYAATLPELRALNRPVPAADLRKAMLAVLTKRELPQALEQEFEAQWQAAASRESGFDEAYDQWLVRFYLKHRGAILALPENRMAAAEAQGLMPGAVPKEALAKLEAEFPELGLADLEGQRRELAALHPMRAEWLSFNARAWELLQIHAFMNLYLAPTRSPSPHEAAGRAISAEYRRLFALAGQGGSLPHLLRRAHAAILDLYRRHHAQILEAVVAKAGLEAVVSRLPEMKSPLFDPRVLWAATKISPVLAESDGLTARVARILQRAISNAKPRQELEAMLWEFEPCGEGAQDAQLQANLAPMGQALLRFYLAQRRGIHPRLDAHASEISRTKENWKEFWETAALMDAPLDERRQKLDTFLKSALYDFPIQVARGSLPSGEEQETIIKADLSDASLQASLRLKGIDISKPIQRIDLTAFQRMKMWLAVALPNPYRKLENLAGIASLRGKPAAAEQIQADLHRAASLLAAGLEPNWVLRMLKERILKTYQQHRDDILGTVSFAGYVAQLEETGRVPAYEVEDRIRRAAKNPLFAPMLTAANPLFVRIFAMVFQGEAPEALRLGFSTKIGPLVDQKTPEEVTEAAARYFLQNFEGFTLNLMPWSEADPNEIARISRDPLITRLDREEFLPRALPRPKAIEPEDMANDLFLRILACIEHPDMPRSLQKSFQQLWKTVRPQSTGALTHSAVNFFMMHEDEIRRAAQRIRP